MLKLLKYEFTHSMRSFGMSYLVVLVGCAILPFLVNTTILDNFPIIAMLFGVGFTFLILGIMIALFVNIFLNYKRSMLQRPAYLTLTLPVSNFKLVVSKILMSMIWLMISFIVFIIGILIMVLISQMMYSGIDMKAIFSGIGDIMSSIVDYIKNGPLNLWIDIVTMIGGMLVFISAMYFSLTITHTKYCRRQRTLKSFIIYIVLLICVGWLATILFGNNQMDYVGANLLSSYFGTLYEGIYNCLFGILFIFGTVYILDHHIEIE